MRFRGGFKTGLLILVLAAGLFQVAVLGRNVAQQVDHLSKANSGDGVWHLSQLEVDYRRLTTAVARAEDASGYGEVRHRFDVFFSRVLTLQEGDGYQVFRNQPEFASNLKLVTTYLTTALPYVDASDTTMAENLGMLRDSTDAIEAAVRQMAVAAVQNSSRRNQTLRNETRDVLQRLFAVSVALIVGLILLVIVLRHLYSRSRQISDENKLGRARIASMIHASLDGMLVTDPEGNLLEMNQAAERMFQTHVPMSGKLHLSALIEGIGQNDSYQNPAKSGLLAKGRIQTTAKRKGGTVFPIEVSLMQATLEQRSDIYVAYVRDISTRLHTEDRLRQARDEAQAGEQAKARLLAVMSHEIRTPLNGVLGAVDLLSKTPLDDDQRRYIGAMQTSGGILERHINDVLEMSRLDDAPKPRELAAINLHDVVPEIVASQRALADQSATTLSARVFEAVPEAVLGDRLAIQQALLNLVSNAIKFSAGGSVSVEADHFGEGDVIEFRVIDDGIGISEDEIERVFEDFYATDTSFARRKQGTGLGLGITKRIVTAMGGEIGAESIAGEGSLFWFRVPMKPSQIASTTHAADELSAKSRFPSEILLVEDNAINRMIATEMLENAGHKVAQAQDGVSGIELAKSRSFDAILMDISMPGMDGFAAAKAIRQSSGASNEAPIIALTAQAITASATELERLGIQGVLQKPVTSQALINSLDAIIGGTKAPQDASIVESKPEKLNTDILSDVLQNIGAEKTMQHFEALRDDLNRFSEVGISSEDVDPLMTHKLSGAAAVLGLCALHKYLSDFENADGDKVSLSGLNAEWRSAEKAFHDHLQSISG